MTLHDIVTYCVSLCIQDPNTIKHEVAPSGEMYAMPQTKGKKKKKASDDDGAVGKELTKEEKAALYSVPDRKGQKAKSAGVSIMYMYCFPVYKQYTSDHAHTCYQ